MFHPSSTEKRYCKNKQKRIMKYKFSKKLPEVAIIEPEVHYDYRGEYIETWNIENYKVFDYLNKNSEKIVFKQDDISTSVKHTLRGLHGDTKTFKLVQCLYGSLLQVVVDFREDSDTYLEFDMFPLNDKNRNQILIPPGYVNGHLVMSESAMFSYKQSTLYGGPGSQFTIKWNDPKLNIPWPIDNPILSSRDKNAKLL